MGEPLEDEKTKNLRTVLQVLVMVMNGKRLSRHEVAKHLGFKLAVADRKMLALTVVPGVQVKRGEIFCDGRYVTETPSDVMILAGAMALSVSRIFGSSSQAMLMRKLLERMIRGARKQISHVERKFHFVERGGEKALESPSHSFDEISQAVRDSNWLLLTYRHNDGTREYIRVRPLTITIFEHQLYLIAQGQEMSAPYPFRVARIEEAEILDETFEYPSKDDYSPDALFQHSLGIHTDPATPVEIIQVQLSGPWARYALSHRWHRTHSNEENAAGVLVTMRVRCCREVDRWILGMGEHAKVIAPESLRARIAEALRRGAERYE